MPVTRQPKVLAMYRAGPPMPQPMSSTRSPDAAPSASPTKRLASLPPMLDAVEEDAPSVARAKKIFHGGGQAALDEMHGPRHGGGHAYR